VDPRFKIELVKIYFIVIYQEPKATTNIEFVLQVLHELYDKYVKDHNSTIMENSE
jgi:hypothetical protein